MQKIVIKRKKQSVNVKSVHRGVTIKKNVRKVTIRSSSKRGLPGPDGGDGKSAYEVWLDEGNTGTEQDFFDSLQGEPGPPGAQGGAFSTPFSGQTISIIHNLGFVPNLQMYDTAGDEVVGAIIERDNNHFTVQFSASVSGIAYCS